MINSFFHTVAIMTSGGPSPSFIGSGVLLRIEGVDYIGTAAHVVDELSGRYVAERRVAHGLLGSANQTVHLLNPRHTPEEIAATPEAEAVILPDGRVVFSGIAQA